MTIDNALAELIGYQGKAPILSVYLDTDLAAKSKDAVKLEFRNLKSSTLFPRAGCQHGHHLFGL